MTYEYTTPELVQAELRAADSFASFTLPSIDAVNEWIEEASEEINHVSGRIYGETEYTEYIDYRGEDRIYLKNAPLIEVETVLYSEAPLGSPEYSLSILKEEGVDYEPYLEEGYLYLLPSWKPSLGSKRIQIVYTAGYEVIPKTIQQLATKMVAKRVLDTIIEADLNEQKSGKTTAVGPVRITKSSSFGVSQYKVLHTDIDRLKEKIIGGTTAYRVPIHRF
jgi:hypothetical protein